MPCGQEEAEPDLPRSAQHRGPEAPHSQARFPLQPAVGLAGQACTTLHPLPSERRNQVPEPQTSLCPPGAAGSRAPLPRKAAAAMTTGGGHSPTCPVTSSPPYPPELGSSACPTLLAAAPPQGPGQPRAPPSCLGRGEPGSCPVCPPPLPSPCLLSRGHTQLASFSTNGISPHPGGIG